MHLGRHTATGEEPHSGIVASVERGSPALVTCIDDERLEFQVGRDGHSSRSRCRCLGICCACAPLTGAAACSVRPVPNRSCPLAWLPQDDQLVTFTEVVGMQELNSHKPIRVSNCKVRRGQGCQAQVRAPSDHARPRLCLAATDSALPASLHATGGCRSRLPSRSDPGTLL